MIFHLVPRVANFSANRATLLFPKVSRHKTDSGADLNGSGEFTRVYWSWLNLHHRVVNGVLFSWCGEDKYLQ